MLEFHRIAAQSSWEKLCCDLGKLFDALLKAAEPLIRALLNRGVLMALSSENLVKRRTRNMVLIGHVADFLLVLVIGLVDLLSLKRSGVSSCELPSGSSLRLASQFDYPENVNNTSITHT